MGMRQTLNFGRMNTLLLLGCYGKLFQQGLSVNMHNLTSPQSSCKANSTHLFHFYIMFAFSAHICSTHTRLLEIFAWCHFHSSICFELSLSLSTWKVALIPHCSTSSPPGHLQVESTYINKSSSEYLLASTTLPTSLHSPSHKTVLPACSHFMSPLHMSTLRGKPE